MPHGNASGASLADGLYWYAEKLMWGYEGVERNPQEAFKLFRQAAELGSSDASIRLGQLLEYGKGTERDPRAAIKKYQAAARKGNFFALAYLAKLLSKTSHLAKAAAIWARFFAELNRNPDASFQAASRGELLHDYVVAQLRLGLAPMHTATLRQHRLEIITHHQQLLEHTPDELLDSLEGVTRWMKENL